MGGHGPLVVTNKPSQGWQLSGKTRGNRRGLYQTKLNLNLDTFKAIKTDMTATAVRIDLPEDVEIVMIKHVTAGEVVWVGEDDTIVAVTGDVYPLQAGEEIILDVKKGNEINLFGISDGTTVPIYAAGMIKE